MHEGCEMCLHRRPKLWDPSASREAPTSHTVTRNRHHPEGFSPHPKADVISPHWLKRWWWVQTVRLRLVRCTSPSHTLTCRSGPSFRLFPQYHARVSYKLLTHCCTNMVQRSLYHSLDYGDMSAPCLCSASVKGGWRHGVCTHPTIIACLLAGHCREAYENALFIKKETQSRTFLVLIRKLLSNQFRFLPGVFG